MLIVAYFDRSSGRYVVPASDERVSMSFSCPWQAARAGIVVAGELPAGAPPCDGNVPRPADARVNVSRPS